MVESPSQTDLFPRLDADFGAGVFYSHDKGYAPADQLSLIEKTRERIKLLNEHVRAIRTSVEAAPKYLDVLAWLTSFEAELLAIKLKLLGLNEFGSISMADSMPFPPEAPSA